MLRDQSVLCYQKSGTGMMAQKPIMTLQLDLGVVCRPLIFCVIKMKTMRDAECVLFRMGGNVRMSLHTLENIGPTLMVSYDSSTRRISNYSAGVLFPLQSEH